VRRLAWPLALLGLAATGCLKVKERRPAEAPAFAATAAPFPVGGDVDGDGLADALDRCPTEAEDRDGFQDEDGCPEPDNDRDGVADAADPCPNEPGPGGCPGAGLRAVDDGGYGFTLERGTFRRGESIVVRFSRPLDAPAGQQRWITLAPAGSPDGTWGEWKYLPSGARSFTLRAPAPGRWEVRLHDLYPRVPYRVLARAPIDVTP